MNLFTKQQQTHRHKKQAYDYQRGVWWGGINQDFGTGGCKLPYIKEINDKTSCIAQELYSKSCNRL